MRNPKSGDRQILSQLWYGPRQRLSGIKRTPFKSNSSSGRPQREADQLRTSDRQTFYRIRLYCCHDSACSDWSWPRLVVLDAYSCVYELRRGRRSIHTASKSGERLTCLLAEHSPISG